MTALVVENPSSVTPWSFSIAIGNWHAVLIVRPGPGDAHSRQAQDAETRPAKERQC